MPPVNATPAPPEIDGAEQRTVTIQARDVGPLDVHLYEAGDGPPVLLLHGWPQDAASWRYVIPRLADRYRLIAPDLRGFGQSDAPGTGYDGMTFGADAIALLDALDIQRAHLIGHDWGGFAAFTAGIAAPRRVASMVVLNTIPPWVEPRPRLARELWRAWYVVAMAAAGDRIVRDRPGLIARMLRGDRVHDGISRADAEAYVARLQRPASAVATKLLYRSYLRTAGIVLARRGHERGRLEPPTHFLFGTNDLAIPHRLLDGIERHCDDLELELVPDSGHFIAEEKPELVARRAAELFARAPVAAPSRHPD
ncbi:MAG TPA: alpha/beta hydrolase [Solirubrobacteraceae bacterium]|nr:alpha/beta hydrolase [Solirubrobacteraceae bacterium]